ncbi:MAG: leucine-rich repeat protein [Mycoplasma sp.]
MSPIFWDIPVKKEIEINNIIWIYSINEYNTIKIYDFHDNREKDKEILVFPDNIEGFDVYSIYIKKYDEDKKYKEVILPKKIKTIGGESFQDWEELEKIQLPEGLRIIEWSAFEGCKNLKGVLELPDSVIDLGEGCFYGTNYEKIIMDESILKLTLSLCIVERKTKLEGKKISKANDSIFSYIELNDKLIEIYDFSNYTKAHKNLFEVVDLVIPKEIDGLKVVSINENLNCTDWRFKNLIIEAKIKKLKDRTFQEIIFDGSLTLPESLEIIEDRVFEYCGFVGKIKLPKNLKSIGVYAFAGSRFEGELILPEGLENIRFGAFENNSRLNGELIIPSSAKWIDNYAFAGCVNIEKLTILNQETKIGKYSFKYCKELL